ncbi:MAG: YggS family pyridoxal phosphate-dependent enzyme [Candidatus Glassbacteria bacterium]
MPIVENLARVRERINRAERAAGLTEGAVRLVGVTKNRTVREIETAIEAGLEDIGENRLQEAAAKLPQVQRAVTKHFVGHLQRNKVRDVLGLFDLIQSVDSVRLVEEIEKRAGQAGLTVSVLAEVNTSGEESKFGVAPEATEEILKAITGCSHVQFLGLMTIGPLAGTGAQTAASFRTLKKLYDEFSSRPGGNCRMEVLSMGMSADFEIAIAEGANMVRVGTAIFGPRM